MSYCIWYSIQPLLTLRAFTSLPGRAAPSFTIILSHAHFMTSHSLLCGMENPTTTLYILASGVKPVIQFQLSCNYPLLDQKSQFFNATREAIAFVLINYSLSSHCLSFLCGNNSTFIYLVYFYIGKTLTLGDSFKITV
jgi:hypothetical protein